MSPPPPLFPFKKTSIFGETVTPQAQCALGKMQPKGRRPYSGPTYTGKMRATDLLSKHLNGHPRKCAGLYHFFQLEIERALQRERVSHAVSRTQPLMAHQTQPYYDFMCTREDTAEGQEFLSCLKISNLYLSFLKFRGKCVLLTLQLLLTKAPSSIVIIRILIPAEPDGHVRLHRSDVCGNHASGTRSRCC